MTTALKNPDYSEAADVLMALFDAATKLMSTAARGKEYGLSDRMAIKGLATLTQLLAEAGVVDLTDAYRSITGGPVGEFVPDARWANRALLCLNERLLASLRGVLAAQTRTDGAARLCALESAFEAHSVRELHAIVMEFAAAVGVPTA